MKDALIKDMARTAVDWTDEQLAAKAVELLIHDKGVVNAWDRTMRLIISITRKREQIMLAKTDN